MAIEHVRKSVRCDGAARSVDRSLHGHMAVNTPSGSAPKVYSRLLYAISFESTFEREVVQRCTGDTTHKERRGPIRQTGGDGRELCSGECRR